MEGKRIVSSKLKFVESKTRFKTTRVEGQSLIAAANNHGLAIVAVGNEIKAVNLDPLVNHDRANVITCDLTEYVFSIPLTFKPSQLTVARYGFSSVLLVSGLSTDARFPIVEAIDLDSRTSIGKLELTQFSGSEIRDCAWHPNYYDSIAAICTSRGTLAVLAIDKKVRGLAIVYNNPQYGALTCCWSPKGKNLAIGMSNGRIVRLEPVVSSDSFNFKEVDKSTFIFSHEKITPEHQIVKLIWVNKTFLLCVHAKLNNPNGTDTIYSVITTRSSKPYLYWTNVVFENKVEQNYQVYLTNLFNAVICATNTSGEAAVIGIDGAAQVGSSDVNDWNSVIIDEEGARIELPLDSENRETYPVGVALAYKPHLPDKPIIIFYTNDGVLCPYNATHTEDILKVPEMQQPQDCPISVPKSTNTDQLSGGSMFGGSGGGGGFLSFASLAAASTGAQAPANSINQPSQPTLSFESLAAASMGASLNMNSLNQPSQSFLSFESLAKATNLTLPTIPAPVFSFDKSASLFRPSNEATNNMMQNKDILKASAIQQPAKQPIQQPAQQSVQQPVQQPALQPVQQPAQQPVQQSVLQQPKVSQPSASKPEKTNQATILTKDLWERFKIIEKSNEFNQTYMGSLDDINRLRSQIIEISESHELHREVLDAVRADIDGLDMKMLECLYLIEYIKSRSKARPPKNTLDPTTVKKVDEIKLKSRQVADKLRDLNIHVDITWENHLRTTNKNKEPNSLEMIYKTIVLHQKIISVLKCKAKSLKVTEPPEEKRTDDHIVLSHKNVLDPARIESFRRFLASRNVVPVRHPEPVKRVSSHLD